MSQARLRGGLAGVATAVIFAIVLLGLRPFSADSQGQRQGGARGEPERPAAPIAMTPGLTQVRITLGLKDEMAADWSGELSVSEGKVKSLAIGRGNAKAEVKGNQFSVKSVRAKKKKNNVDPVIEAVLDAPPTAKVTVKTPQGDFSFVLGELPAEKATKFLKGNASVARQEGTVTLTGPDTEDDYPVMTRTPDGTAWLVYNEYVLGQPLIKERVLAGNFDELVPTGNGDQVRLMKFDGKQWHPSVAVTEPGLNVWRPTVAADGDGNLVIAWAQQVDGNWDVYYRRYTPGEGGAGTWSDVVRLTREPGSDFHAVAATDSKGVVWLAWQGWRDDRFQILLAALREGHPAAAPKAVSAGKGNNWGPSIAADSKGNVYVAYDSYDGDSYNVHVYRAGQEPKTFDVATSPRFEARPDVACDGQDRLWVAYELGDEQWGKDYSTNAFRKIGLEENPGNGLYLERTVQVRCLDGGELKEPAADLQAAMAQGLTRKKSVPELVLDKAGGLWLWLRHHPNPTGAGEVWVSFALRYDGKEWSAPQRIADSTYLLDHRPALLPHERGVLEVHASDDRVRSQQRKQTDLYAVIIPAVGEAGEPKLVAAQPGGERQLKPVHPDEAEQVARIRDYRIDYNGKKLRPVRGEFHRHTEYTAHNDGDGLFEDSWRYALDAGMLDWMGNGDHDNGFGDEYPWWQIQKVTDLMNHPPTFVAALTYERSAVFPNGHRNVMMPRRGIRPLPRGDLKGTPEKGTPDTKVLYRYLKHFGGICSSHTSGTDMGTDWRDNDPVAEPVVEIYQGHRHNYEHKGAPRSATQETNIGGYQPSGYVWNAFGKGYKMGFQSSSDHISTHMSYGVALVPELSRQAVIDAFKARHSYAATDNIIMDVRSGEHLMGDEFTSKERPTLQIKVQGTRPIAKLHVVRDNEYVYSVMPMKADVQLRYTDATAKPGQSHYYYVRVEQTDSNLAWASPMWITYRPE